MGALRTSSKALAGTCKEVGTTSAGGGGAKLTTYDAEERKAALRKVEIELDEADDIVCSINYE